KKLKKLNNFFFEKQKTKSQFDAKILALLIKLCCTCIMVLVFIFLECFRAQNGNFLTQTLMDQLCSYFILIRPFIANTSCYSIKRRMHIVCLEEKINLVRIFFSVLQSDIK